MTKLLEDRNKERSEIISTYCRCLKCRYVYKDYAILH